MLRVLIGFLCITGSYWNLLIFALTQPFLHNDSYYNFRHYLNNKVYSYGLFNHSDTSTATMTEILTPDIRKVLFTIGIILLFLLSSCKPYECTTINTRYPGVVRYYFTNGEPDTEKRPYELTLIVDTADVNPKWEIGMKVTQDWIINESRK